VLSLSTLLQYADSQRVFNFLHTITGRVSAADYLGVATLDPTTQNPKETNTLTSLFDAVVELREADDGTREMRVVGLPDVPRTWVSF
jgi:archaellum biogenesis ATPase FlaH